MKKIIIFLVMLKCIYAYGSINKIERLEKRLEKVNKKNIQIEDNKKKYNRLMTEYKIASSLYQNLINLCKKRNCFNEMKQVNQNFEKLEKSIKTLDGMIEADIANMYSLEKQKETINAFIKMEKLNGLLKKTEVEKVIDEM